jgi:hypothetical protein
LTALAIPLAKIFLAEDWLDVIAFATLKACLIPR